MSTILKKKKQSAFKKIIRTLEILSKNSANDELSALVSELSTLSDKRIIDLPVLSIQSGTDIKEISTNGTGSYQESRTQEMAYINENAQLPSSAKVTGLDDELNSKVSLTGNQTIGGIKTFSLTVNANITGSAVFATTSGSTNNATNAANVGATITNPAGLLTYYPAFVSNYASANQAIGINNAFRFGAPSGSLSLAADPIFEVVGSSTARLNITGTSNPGTADLYLTRSQLTIPSSSSTAIHLCTATTENWKIGLRPSDNLLHITDVIANIDWMTIAPSTGFINFPSLAASQAIVTDSLKNLVSLAYTPTNVISTLVQRDASGNFSANTITANLTGNATNATNAATVTTNANLTGPITSVGNATSVTTGSITNSMLAGNIDLTTKVTGILPVGNGGTGIASGVSGGIPYFSGASTIASSAALLVNQIMLGGGAGAAPAVIASLGTATTVLHGNASGAPTFGAVSLTTDVSGTLQFSHGGFGFTTCLAGDIFFASANDTPNRLSAVGVGQVIISNGIGAVPVYSSSPTVSQITLTNSGGPAASLANTGTINAKNSSGTSEVWVIPRWSDNKTYFDIGSAGLVMRQNAAGTTFMTVDTSGNVNFAQGDINVTTLGKSLSLKNATNGATGSFTLVAGTATVSNTSVAATDVIIVSPSVMGGVVGSLPFPTVSAGVSITFNGLATDASTYKYIKIKTT